MKYFPLHSTKFVKPLSAVLFKGRKLNFAGDNITDNTANVKKKTKNQQAIVAQ